MIRYLILFIFLQLVVSLQAEEKDSDSIKYQIVAHKLYYDFSGLYRETMDTSLLHFEFYNPVFQNFTLNQYIGNFTSPISLVTSTEKISQYNNIFNQSIAYNFYNAENTDYYTTRSPYSVMKYFTGGPKSRQEQDFQFTHTQNVNKKLNIGILGHLKYSDGEFANQKDKGNSFKLFSDYNGDRYKFYFNANLNTLKYTENGGVADDSTYEAGFSYPKYTIPVKLQAASSISKNFNIFFQHRYFLTGTYKTDSIKTQSKWNDVVSIIHRLRYEKSSRTFTDILTSKGDGGLTDFDFYTNIYRDSTKTKDSVYFRQFENTFLLAINAMPVLKIPAELRFGIKNQLDRISYNAKLDSFYTDTYVNIFPPINILIGDSLTFTKSYSSVQNYGLGFTNERISHNYINTAITGSLTNRFSKTLTWGVSVDLFFTGYKAGNLYINGDIAKSIKNNFLMKLYGNFTVEKSPYLISDFESNHFLWHNSFPVQSSTYLKAEISHTKLKLKFEGENGSYVNYYYFGLNATPEVASDPISVLRLSGMKYLDIKFFHTMLKLTFQQSTNDAIMPMPAFSGFNTSYIELFLFQKVLQFQMGYDIFYNSPYYFKNYMPATGLFYNQRVTKSSNAPFADLFLNIKIKRAKASIKYENITSYLNLPFGYFSPHYPYNPGILKVGISWNFYD